MNFSEIIQQIIQLKNGLEQISLSAIERDIVKSRLSDLYLLLSESIHIIPETSFYPEPERMSQFIEKEPVITIISSTPEQPLQPMEQQPVENMVRKSLDIDYKSLADVFLEKEPTKQEPKSDNSLLSKLAQTKITDLKRSIAMNERFIFIKELFKNDFEAYNQYINHLNACTGIEHARQYLAHLQIQYGWEEKNETVQYFISLVERKFV